MSRLLAACCAVTAMASSIVVAADDRPTPTQAAPGADVARALWKAGVNAVPDGRESAARAVARIVMIDERPHLFDEATGWEYPSMNDALMELLPELPDLTEVNLDSTRVTDEGLQQLPRIMNLQRLELSDTRSRHEAGAITNRGIGAMARCHALKRLKAWGIPVSDEGWRLLAGLEHVEEMTIGYCALSPQGLAAIGSLPTLRVLRIEACSCEATGLQALWRSRTLERLSLRRSTFDPRDLDGIAECRQLTHVDGSFTSIDDGAVRAICGLRNLQDLNLSTTMITDESVAALASCKSLKLLGLPIRVSEAARDELRRELPGATVP